MEPIFRFRNRDSKSGIENAPQFAYKIMYGKHDSSLIGRSYFTPKKKINIDNMDIYIDVHLDEKLIQRLNNIVAIEIRSTCEGHDSKHITHIIFRPHNQDLDYIKNIIKKLNSLSNTKSDFGAGNGGLYRIGVVTRNWYRDNADNSKWKEWWKNSVKSLESIFI